MKILISIALTALFGLTGCAHVISEEARRMVDPTVSFAKLREDPGPYAGKYVMLGGIIAAIKNSKEGSQLEVVQTKLADDGTPEDIYRSGGRFLATTPDFLDAVIYKPGRLVTIVGEVKGKATLPLDEVQYTYPVIGIRELYLWKNYEHETGYPYPAPYYYDPYYFGYWPGPFWHRPVGPILRPW